MAHIFLYGPPGSGKSTIGKAIARKLHLPFIDLDRVVENNAGMSIPQIMDQQGENSFRDLETVALRSFSSEKESVIALGGGTLLREENRSVAEQHGKVLLLTAESSTLLERLQNTSNKRPLLTGDLKSKLTSLLKKREEHYDSFSYKICVDGNSIEQNARQALSVLGRHHLSAMGECNVVVGPINHLHYENSLIVTDENVANFHLEKIKHAFDSDIKCVVIPSGEKHKNLETISFLWDSFLENSLDRKSTIIALGGGVIGDLTGFAASTYMRGIDWVALPTTLLAMVDASLGGKTGFDLPQGKNLIGSFHPPKAVLVDPRFLDTLPPREFRSGMAEVVKHGIIADLDLFAMCGRGLESVNANLEEIIKRAMEVKIKIIEEDPYEKGFRAALNLGHTVGHAVELVSKFEVSHGEAVSIGIATEAKYSARIGLASRSMVDAITTTLSALGLPVQIPSQMSRAEIIQTMNVDKKKHSKSIRFALPIAVGKVELVDVDDLESVLE